MCCRLLCVVWLFCWVVGFALFVDCWSLCGECVLLLVIVFCLFVVCCMLVVGGCSFCRCLLFVVCFFVGCVLRVVLGVVGGLLCVD